MEAVSFHLTSNPICGARTAYQRLSPSVGTPDRRGRAPADFKSVLECSAALTALTGGYRAATLIFSTSGEAAQMRSLASISLQAMR